MQVKITRNDLVVETISNVKSFDVDQVSKLIAIVVDGSVTNDVEAQ